MPNPPRRISFPIEDELYGNTNSQLTLSERWCWMALRLWCANSPHQPYVCCGTYSRRVGWTDRVIAESLCVPQWQWKLTKRKLVEMRVINVSEGNVIKINDWKKWQENRWRKAQERIKREYKKMFAKDKKHD